MCAGCGASGSRKQLGAGCAKRRRSKRPTDASESNPKNSPACCLEARRTLPKRHSHRAAQDEQVPLDDCKTRNLPFFLTLGASYPQQAQECIGQRSVAVMDFEVRARALAELFRTRTSMEEVYRYWRCNAEHHWMAKVQDRAVRGERREEEEEGGLPEGRPRFLETDRQSAAQSCRASAAGKSSARSRARRKEAICASTVSSSSEEGNASACNELPDHLLNQWIQDWIDYYIRREPHAAARDEPRKANASASASPTTWGARCCGT